MTKSILPILSSCLRGKHFYTGKMTENEHNYNAMNVTYARFEIQLIDLLVPRRLKCLVENAIANDPDW